MSSVSKSVIYYTNNICDENIFNTVLLRLKKITGGMEQISVSHKKVDFGKNIVVHLPSTKESILRQIYAGVNECTSDVVYLAEHDVLYHPSHFEFVPKNPWQFFYNTNIWQLDSKIGVALFKKSKRTSQLVVYRKALKEYFVQLFKRIDTEGYKQRWGIAPKTHRIDGISNSGLKTFSSALPNVDIRHENNISEGSLIEFLLFRQSEECIPYWGKTKGRFNEFLKESMYVN